MQTLVPGRSVRLAGLTLINTVIQIITMSLIKYSTAIERTQYVVLLAFYGAILVFNLVRFVVWGQIHREFPLGIAYASSAIIFPCIVLLSIYYGEPFTWHQLLGVALVMTGVVALMRDV